MSTEVKVISVEQLRPSPRSRIEFAWSHFKQVPNESGCYVLTTFGGDVMYVGQATSSIRDRFCAHLDTPEKRALGPFGVAFWFYYFVCEPNRVSSIEQGWMNVSILKTGQRPILNKVDAPT